MSNTTEQVKHEIKGATEKAAGAVTSSDELKDQGEEHLEEAHEMEEARDAKKLGISEGSDGTTHHSWKS